MAKKSKAEPGSPAPTAAYVGSLWDWKIAQEAEERLRRFSMLFRVLTRLEHEVQIPEQYRAISRQVKTPFLRDTWHRVTAALTHNSPTCHVEPIDENKASREAANIGERWTLAAIDRMNAEIGEDCLYEATRSLIRDGESVIKVVLRSEAWANFPKRNDDESAGAYESRAESHQRSYRMPFPFAWRSVDRQTMVFEDGEMGDSWCVEQGEYPIPYLMQRYGVVSTSLDGKDRLRNPANLIGGKPQATAGIRASSLTGTMIKQEYWSDRWWHVVIDGEDAPGFPKKNPYNGQIPYFRAKAPDSESLLYALLFLVPRLDELMTMKLNWSFLGAYPNPVLEPTGATNQWDVPLPLADAPGSSAQNPGGAFNWTPGKLLTPPAGYKLSFLSPPPVGRDLDELAGIFRELIDIAGIPSVFRGVGASGQSGYAVNQLSAAATLTYRRLAVSSAQQMQQACQFLWHLVETVDQPVYVHAPTDGGKEWLCLKPEGSVTTESAPVNLLGPLTFQFRPILPTDEQARAMVATELVGAGLNSKRYAMETHLQIEDPEQVLDQIAVERALDTEPLLSLWTQRALIEAGEIPDPTNPASQLVMPDGSPMIGGARPNTPGAMTGVGGAPFVPGLSGPVVPPTPQSPPIQAGGQPGRPNGAYPGMPAGQR